MNRSERNAFLKKHGIKEGHAFFYNLMILKEAETIENPWTKVNYKCSPILVALYDFINGVDYYLLNKPNISPKERSKWIREQIEAKELFLSIDHNAYMALID